MKQSIGKFLILSVLMLNSLSGWAQLRIYTRSYMIQDLKSKPTKVVLNGPGEFNAALRQEINSLWTVTPYEFCTAAEYEKQKNSPDCYFLHTETGKGIVYLALSRGGNKNDADAIKRPVTIISMPVCGEQDKSGRELVYMPAFVSLIQDYAEAALNSECAAYGSLKAVKSRKPKEVTVYTDPDKAAEAFRSQYTDAASLIIVSPDGSSKGRPRYEMTVGTSDYRLYRYAKH